MLHVRVIQHAPAVVWLYDAPPRVQVGPPTLELQVQVACKDQRFDKVPSNWDMLLARIPAQDSDRAMQSCGCRQTWKTPWTIFSAAPLKLERGNETCCLSIARLDGRSPP